MAVGCLEGARGYLQGLPDPIREPRSKWDGSHRNGGAGERNAAGGGFRTGFDAQFRHDRPPSKQAVSPRTRHEFARHRMVSGTYRDVEGGYSLGVSSFGTRLFCLADNSGFIEYVIDDINVDIRHVECLRVYLPCGHTDPVPELRHRVTRRRVSASVPRTSSGRNTHEEDGDFSWSGTTCRRLDGDGGPGAQERGLCQRGDAASR